MSDPIDERSPCADSAPADDDESESVMRQVLAARDEYRGLLMEVRDWFDDPDGEPTSGDLLDRINEALA